LNILREENERREERERATQEEERRQREREQTEEAGRVDGNINATANENNNAGNSATTNNITSMPPILSNFNGFRGGGPVSAYKVQDRIRCEEFAEDAPNERRELSEYLLYSLGFVRAARLALYNLGIDDVIVVADICDEEIRGAVKTM
jgi:hypothetical protein